MKAGPDGSHGPGTYAADTPRDTSVNENRLVLPPEKQKRLFSLLLRTILLEVLVLLATALLGFSLQVFRPAEVLVDLFHTYAPAVVVSVLFLILVKLVLDVINLVLTSTVERYRASEASVRTIWRLIYYTVWFFVLLALFLSFVSDVWAYMFSIGVILAALIYALADVIKDVLAWFIIVIRRPFRIGDVVEVDGRRGYVVDVGLTHTQMREMGNWVPGELYTGRITFVPNRNLLSDGVYNYTLRNPFVYDFLGVLVTYESDVDLAARVLRECVEERLSSTDFSPFLRAVETEDLYKKMPGRVEVFMDLRDSGIEVGALYLVSLFEKTRVRSDVYRCFLRRIRDIENVEIAYPHVEVVGLGGGGKKDA